VLSLPAALLLGLLLLLLPVQLNIHHLHIITN
jgi:hypothetical protein